MDFENFCVCIEVDDDAGDVVAEESESEVLSDSRGFEFDLWWYGGIGEVYDES